MLLRELLPPGAEPAYVVLDDSERLLQGARLSRSTLPALTRLAEVTDRNVGVLFVGRASGMDLDLSLDEGLAAWNTVRAVPFPDFTAKELLEVLARHAPPPPPGAPHSAGEDAALFRKFLERFVMDFSRRSRNLAMLLATLLPLYEHFRAPVLQGLKGPGDYADLGKMAAGRAQQAMRGFGQLVTREVQGRAKTDQLGFDLTCMAKWVVLAAFVCSTNPEDADRRVFGGARGRKRGRRDMAGADRRDDLKVQAHLEGPRSFGLERLLAVLKCLLKAELEFMDPDPERAGRRAALGEQVACGQLNNEMLHQIENLVSLRLLTRSSKETFDPRVTYTCAADRKVVEAMARNLDVRLDSYLTYI